VVGAGAAASAAAASAGVVGVGVEAAALDSLPKGKIPKKHHHDDVFSDFIRTGM